MMAKFSPETVHSTAFEETIEGKKLLGINLGTHLSTTNAKCALICNKNELCRSFNFCGTEICELNKEDVYSTQSGETILQNASECSYFGMRRSSKPLCKEKGNFIDIKEDERLGGCRIHGKRVDREWSQWADIVILENQTESRTVQNRGVTIEAAHGGSKGESEAEKTVLWLKFVKERLPWQEAKENCIKIGGNLFSNVDGTKAQLVSLLSKMENQNHWVGIFTEDHQTWKAVNGSIIDGKYLFWKEGQPNNANNKQFHVENFVKDLVVGLNDISQSAKKGSVCDLL